MRLINFEKSYLRARHSFHTGTSLLEHFRSLEAYFVHWFNRIGIVECADLLLVEPEDVLPPLLESYEREMVLRKLPDEVVIGSKPATITYELDKRLAILHMDKRWVKAPINPRFCLQLKALRSLCKMAHEENVKKEVFGCISSQNNSNKCC